jgi:hypothetical protein
MFPSDEELDAVDEELRAEGFWEDVKRRYGEKIPVQTSSGKPFSPALVKHQVNSGEFNA